MVKRRMHRMRYIMKRASGHGENGWEEEQQRGEEVEDEKDIPAKSNGEKCDKRVHIDNAHKGHKSERERFAAILSSSSTNSFHVRTNATLHKSSSKSN